jgi:hypothetical protein
MNSLHLQMFPVTSDLVFMSDEPSPVSTQVFFSFCFPSAFKQMFPKFEVATARFHAAFRIKLMKIYLLIVEATKLPT